MKHKIEVGETPEDFINGTVSIRIDGVTAKEAEIVGGEK